MTSVRRDGTICPVRTPMRYRFVVGLCLALCACAHSPGIVLPEHLAGTLADDGALHVETIEFPDLIDADRNRKVPVKVHLPGGTEALPVVVLSHGAG